MKLHTNEWYTYPKDTINIETCSKLIELAKYRWEESTVNINKDITKEERITGSVQKFEPDHTLRISELCWANEQWIYDMIWPYMEHANEDAGWGYHIKAAESNQITRYEKGGYYSFHSDGLGDKLSVYKEPDKPFMNSHVRKLSMSIFLNDDFEGGDFEFASYSKEQCIVSPIKPERGSLVVFPSAIEHRVTPVTKGTRYSLVTWFLGPPFV